MKPKYVDTIMIVALRDISFNLITNSLVSLSILFWPISCKSGKMRPITTPQR